MLKDIKKARASRRPDARRDLRGQVLMEFAFTMIVILLMFYGMMMIFRWTGIDLVERRIAHETKLTMNVNESFGGCMQWNTDVFPAVCMGRYDVNSGPQQQLDPYFYEPVSMNAIYQEN